MASRGARSVIICLVLFSASACARNAGTVACQTPAQGEGLDTEICIKGGVFVMGHEKLPKPTENLAIPGLPVEKMPVNDWAPAHEVELSPFYLEKYEVSWGRYRQCVEAGVCSAMTYGPNVAINSRDIKEYEDAANDARPARLTFNAAQIYCTWRQKRLPTEAEYERAARGPRGYDYPWGNTLPDPALFAQIEAWPPLAVDDPFHDVSAEGIVGLFTGRDQWVGDYYDPFYYESSPRKDPRGPEAPGKDRTGRVGGRVIRGYNETIARKGGGRVGRRSPWRC